MLIGWLCLALRSAFLNLGSTEPFQEFGRGPMNYKIQQMFLVMFFKDIFVKIEQSSGSQVN